MTLTDKDVLIAGAQEFIAPYIYDAVEKVMATDDARLWLLGTGSSAGIRFDLNAGVPELPADMSTVIYCDVLDDRGKSYNVETAVQSVKNLVASLEQHIPANLVYVSSVAVYGVKSGAAIGESAVPSPDTRYGKAKLAVEELLTQWCESRGVKLAILRPAMIVGTGMGGELRTLVNRIYRGSYRHIAGNEAQVSVVHATSLADAVVAVIGRNGVWNVTDGNVTSRHDLAEAFAWRLDHKRIYTLPLSKARVIARVNDWLPVYWLDSEALEHEMSTLTFSNEALVTETGFSPVCTVDYMRTHNYDESSL
ncbi:MAG: NAD-dependent epimerase/dehydratase family protein [Muribaculaceae bacterium]|nr:NAD-dependent epimerase/dehydratase family protein [Muribaculaceae bacterium]